MCKGTLLSLGIISLIVSLQAVTLQAATVNFTILHTNDFHGQLEQNGSNPGAARVATVVKGVRSSVGEKNLLLFDTGDIMQGSLISNLQKGSPTIEYYRTLGYDAATFGNHEFDWGQLLLTERILQAEAAPFPPPPAPPDQKPMQMISANIVKSTGPGSCGWEPFDTNVVPYRVFTVGTEPNTVRVGVIGVTTTETPIITIATATEGLCFADPFDAIMHYYDALKAQSDVIVVLSQLGFTDGGYGYGLPVYGDQTLASKLYQAGKPVKLIIGGHSHSNVNVPPPVIHGTTVVQAYYNGRQVGRADLTFDQASKAVTVAWQKLAVNASGPSITPEDPAIKTLVEAYASDPVYQARVNQPVAYSSVDLPRNGGTVDNMMGSFVDDAIYNFLNTDATPLNDVDIFFNNAGGIRADWCWNGSGWVSTGCLGGTHSPGLLTYGNMFTVLPFGNATVVGDMTGAQILQVLNQSPLVTNGVIQPAGLKYKYYAYRDANPGPQPFAWGAFDYCVVNKSTKACDPLDLKKTYRVGTNEFLAPAGGDGYGGFKYMTNITYWGDMLNALNTYVTAHYGSAENAYLGPNGDGTLDNRILRDGFDTPDSGSIIPVTILHHNDSHGNLAKGTYVGFTQLASLIKQERQHNPARTLLLNGGDQIQGDAMMYYFKSAPSGFAVDGTPLPPSLLTHPMMAVMNPLGYDAMTLGNHEFNFGSDTFKGVLAQAQFPLLGANLLDSGSYGLAAANGGAGVQPYLQKVLDGIKIAVLGITNHRVPNYELPSNIVGLSFSNPLAAAQEKMTLLRPQNDVVVALTHIGFTENPKSVEVDQNVDTELATQVPGLDAIVGAHSHTNPASPEAPYKFLPTILGGPDNTPVLINQAYRYNNTLGEIVLGLRAKSGGGYEVASRAGQYLTVTGSTPEDPATKAVVDPYLAQLASYNDMLVGQTTEPIDTLKGFTEETNGANLQADASVWELAQHGITGVDLHLSGAMTNKLMAAGATPSSPFTLRISDMFAGMPYENSLVTMSMNGPQLKAVLERAYRNYYFYKYVPGYGGYSYYTTCMLDVDSVGRIYYRDGYPDLPDGNNVIALLVNGKAVDFSDASKFYSVSTVNYLAAGSCNFNDGGVSLWPLNQITHDTQYYVRDAVIDYIRAKATVSPKVEGRLLFGDTTAPAVTIDVPAAQSYLHPDNLTLSFSAVDGADGTTPSFAAPSGVKSVTGLLDATAVVNGQTINLNMLTLGNHTLTVSASDYYGNSASTAVTFSVTATIASLMTSVDNFYAQGKIDNSGIRNSLLSKLAAAQSNLAKGNTKAAINALQAFISAVTAQSGKHITKEAADLLIADALWVINHL